MNDRRHVLHLIAASAAWLGATASLAGLTACTDQSAKGAAPPAGQFHAIDLTGAPYARGFELIDTEGQIRRLSDFAGQAVVVFFGFTQCPDVCPTTLAEVAQAKQRLGADGARVQALFITLDPERDTPEVMRAYTQAFDPSFIGLRAASPEALAALAKDFKVYYKRVEGSSPGQYTLDHTAASFIYDPQGRLRLYARYGIGAQAMADDLRLLLQG